MICSSYEMCEKAEETSVYSLITELCESYMNANDVDATDRQIKRLRITAYEILLSKKIPTEDSIVCLNSNSDAHSHLLAWKYILISDYGLREIAESLDAHWESLMLDDRKGTLENIVEFLLQIKQYPHTKIRDDGVNFFKTYTESSFKLPPEEDKCCEKFSKDDFKLHKFQGRFKFLQCACKEQERRVENSEFLEVEENVWDAVSKIQFTERRTWESMGDIAPEKEAQFLSESGLGVTYFMPDYPRVRSISKFQFIKDIKNLLVGITSYTFVTNAQNMIELSEGVTVDGISYSALKSYSEQMIFSGSCYKALSSMVVANPYTYKEKGLIFAELCESIKRFLSHYRLAALSLPESKGLIMLHDHLRKLSDHIQVISSICKAGPYAASESIPHGVALLNYLYLKLLEICNKNLMMVLYSIFYPCLQVYFCFFLREWIMEGNVSDPNQEFFVQPNYKYLSTRGRSYWTKSFSVIDAIVPEFLSDLKLQILNCGRATNLLKLCKPNSPICDFGKKANVFQCCITSEQLKQLEKNVSACYLEVIAENGSKFSMKNYLRRSKDEQISFLNLIAAKRAVTLKRIEVEKLKRCDEVNVKKLEEMKVLREQYDEAMRAKKAERAAALELEMKMSEELARMKEMEEKIIKEEAEEMIKYYDTILEKSDQKRKLIQTHIDVWNNVNFDDILQNKVVHIMPIEKHSDVVTNRNKMMSNFDFDEKIASVKHVETELSEAGRNKMKVMATEIGQVEKRNNSDEPRVLTDAQKNKIKVMGTEIGMSDGDVLVSEVVEKRELNEAQRNKIKVMCVEMGSDFEAKEVAKEKESGRLTDAARNKLKVMSTELGIVQYEADVKTEKPKILTEVQRIKMKVLDTEYGLGNNNINALQPIIENTTTTYGSVCDNENFMNKNVPSDEINYIIPPKVHKMDLTLNLVKSTSTRSQQPSFKSYFKSPNFEFPRPMSVDSTPMTDFTTPMQSTATASVIFSEDGFKFTKDSNNINEIANRVSETEVKNISTNCLNRLLKQSVAVPLVAQADLAQNELLRHFIVDLKYLKHLENLRNYFFLLDGEFGRNITDGLFNKLYAVSFPQELINNSTLKSLLFNALDFTSKSNEESDGLSFKINYVPKRLELRNVSVLDCLSLYYKVEWPLNILLPNDTISKYDEVLQFLLKLHRVSWVVKKIFMDLKLLVKETGPRRGFLIFSPQYQNLELARHVMTHFVQTLQSYVVGEVLQTSWVNFEEDLLGVENLEQLYLLHTNYIKNILFMCFLNQRFLKIRNSIYDIFTVILKFYDYLRSRDWEFDEYVYTHPNYCKLEGIFNNFLEFMQFLIKNFKKVSKGYHPTLLQLVDMLDLNEYYSKRFS